MVTTTTTTDEVIAGPFSSEAVLLDVSAVAAMLDCSPRHVYRLSDGGRMPRPIKLGALVRWRAGEIREWIAAGCPSVRAAKVGAR